MPLLVVAAIAGLIFLGTKGDGAIADGAQFAEELQRLQDDALPLLEQIDAEGGDPSHAQRAKLETFHPRLERLLRFDQSSIAAAFLAGKVNTTLRNHRTAEKWLRQCIANAKPHLDKLDVANTELEAHRLLSEIYLRQGEYEKSLSEAEVAASGHPNSPDYRVVKARALVQLKRNAEAEKELRAALRFDPSHSAARGLLDFLTVPSPEK